jgi:hydroxymethylbilane synthase
MPPKGLELVAVPTRADVRDALITRDGRALSALPEGALVGTSSLRREVQLAALRPDLRFASIRGNVDTRLRKVRAGEVDATLLAMAGLTRLGVTRSVRPVALSVSKCVPAPAQGAVGIDARVGDTWTQWVLAKLDHPLTHRAVTMERQVLRALEGGCSLPLGVFARCERGRWTTRIALGDRGLPLRQWLREGPIDRWLSGVLAEVRGG